MSISGTPTTPVTGQARLLPGGPVAEQVLAEVKAHVTQLRARGITPSLATVLVGDDDASAGYIRIKQQQARDLGFVSPHVHLPATATQADLHAAIADLNADPDVHGLLVQYPVPGHLDYDRALQTMDPDKDVDGMHPFNMGRLAIGLPGPLPCTPAGIEALLAHYEIPVAGREVVILGRGATLGRPLAMLLAQKRPTANAAVTVVHTGVPDWGRYTRRADILVAAAGVPGIIQPEHVRPGAVVIGGGVRYAGRRLLPDVDERCATVAGAITPRVGGVGPTTVAMLFRNAVMAAVRASGASV
jgi:methylenetetrahydrofolate dehydrogenase (NADP+)/methenyltetrahydrofolate cyclohydrolase